MTRPRPSAEERLAEMFADSSGPWRAEFRRRLRDFKRELAEAAVAVIKLGSMSPEQRGPLVAAIRAAVMRKMGRR